VTRRKLKGKFAGIAVDHRRIDARFRRIIWRDPLPQPAISSPKLRIEAA
jgi:hypothetical protein